MSCCQFIFSSTLGSYREARSHCFVLDVMNARLRILRSEAATTLLTSLNRFDCRFFSRTKSPCVRWRANKASEVETFNDTDVELQSAAQIESKQKKKKIRLDVLCHEQYPQYSRKILQSWILQGKVVVDKKVINKAGHQVCSTAKVVLNAEENKYVCRAGHKLEKALQQFNINLTGKVALDSGQSTGGFSDCLLQHGIEKVYGVDVGYGQLAEKIRQDPRVVVIERCNLRYLRPEDLPSQVDIACLDLSFISVLKVMPAVVSVLKPIDGVELVVLIKPQFEAGHSQVGIGGVVRDPKVHEAVIEKVVSGIEGMGFGCKGWCESPIRGEKSGNIEFLAYFTRDAPTPVVALS
ncbi:hypothetical protein CEUSTIGMA_g7983.t1 [Chlamydomonas eustigma]|uniref:RNA-binding S4 domain-containing protein n=1 Tax=Chlamydomonas eustigma TaxID=1157962 RepID=A0A250XBU2_9CHLO|nr:hypothetical protein CEUSTIGMA_g7983.t1 [Chlamydomonas eustigma]|eukprot:GAX80545.1 hypothetical protein CEUSTIGMA_g7983.t1 [Chlamydomonas eustigma]